MINSFTKQNKIIGTNIFSLFLILMPILNIYGLFSDIFGIADIIILLLFPFLLLNLLIYKVKYKITIYWFFYIYLILSSTIIILENNGFSYVIYMSILKDILYVIIFAFLAIYYLDLNIAFKIYKIIALILSIIIFVQYLLFIIKGYNSLLIINSPILILRNVNGINNYLPLIKNNFYNNGYRACAIFTEPAKFVQYVSPCLILILFQKNKIKNYIIPLIISLAILLTFSANGIAYLVLIWGMWFLVYIYSTKNTKIKLLYVLVLILIIGFFLYTPEKLIFSRFLEIGANSITSGNMRVLRGWYIFGQLSNINKIFGIGLANITTYIQIHGITTPYDAGYIGYMSGLSEIFVMGGFISGFIYIYIFVKYYKISNNIGRCLILLMFLMLLASDIFHSEIYIICMAYIIKLSYENKCLNNFIKFNYINEKEKIYENINNNTSMY